MEALEIRGGVGAREKVLPFKSVSLSKASCPCARRCLYSLPSTLTTQHVSVALKAL